MKGSHKQIFSFEGKEREGIFFLSTQASLFSIQNLSHAQVGQNLMQNTAASKNGTGIWTSNCLDCVFSENDLQNLDVGMQVRFDHTNTQFSCNVFDACMTGFYFFDATLSDQGDGTNGADNKWLNWNGSQFRMDGNGPLSNNIDYYFDDSSPDFDPDFNNSISVNLSSWINLLDTTSSGCYSISSNYKNNQKSKTIVYPNPIINKLTIETSSSFHYRIYNSVGKEVVLGKSNTNIINLYIDLPAGYYTLQIEKINKIEVFKLLVK